MTTGGIIAAVPGLGKKGGERGERERLAGRGEDKNIKGRDREEQDKWVLLLMEAGTGTESQLLEDNTLHYEWL